MSRVRYRKVIERMTESGVDGIALIPCRGSLSSSKIPELATSDTNLFSLCVGGSILETTHPSYTIRTVSNKLHHRLLTILPENPAQQSSASSTDSLTSQPPQPHWQVQATPLYSPPPPRVQTAHLSFHSSCAQSPDTLP
jgi:hypothetical protein